MTAFPARALWPGRERAPVLRVCIALMTAPGIVASVLSLFAFLVAGMTERTVDGVLRVTLDAAATLSALVFAFTLTFGLAGVALLWRMGWRGIMAWAWVGAAAGTLGGLLFSAASMPAVHPPLVAAFAVTGWSLFLLIRLFAGVRAGARTGGMTGVARAGPVSLRSP